MECKHVPESPQSSLKSRQAHIKIPKNPGMKNNKKLLEQLQEDIELFLEKLNPSRK